MQIRTDRLTNYGDMSLRFFAMTSVNYFTYTKRITTPIFLIRNRHIGYYADKGIPVVISRMEVL